MKPVSPDLLNVFGCIQSCFNLQDLPIHASLEASFKALVQTQCIHYDAVRPLE